MTLWQVATFININSNNCEMFAWYVKTGQRYSGQTQKVAVTKVGAVVVSVVQPVHTVRSIKYLEIEQAIVAKLKQDVEEVKRSKLLKRKLRGMLFGRVEIQAYPKFSYSSVVLSLGAGAPHCAAIIYALIFRKISTISTE